MYLGDKIWSYLFGECWRRGDRHGRVVPRSEIVYSEDRICRVPFGGLGTHREVIEARAQRHRKGVPLEPRPHETLPPLAAAAGFSPHGHRQDIVFVHFHRGEFPFKLQFRARGILSLDWKLLLVF